MINDTEGICLLENLDHDLFMNVGNSGQHLLLQDPYDSIWLKIISVLSYFIGLIASSVMLAFISYENGFHGNFRTVINQLLSNLYAMVSKMFTLTFLHTYITRLLHKPILFTSVDFGHPNELCRRGLGPSI